MKMIRLHKNKKGVTLIELLISFAILSIILVVAFSFFLFNHRLYTKGERLSQVQFDVRMASQYVTTELRNVNEISTTDTSLTNNINLSSLSTEYPRIKSVSFEIENRGAHYAVSYTIQGSDLNNENAYQLETEVLLNNITNATTGNSSTIYYIK
jgi:prepilin-type N-terminal cleavage/methylation domain-containing protein